MFQEWIEELAKLAVGMVVTVLFFFVLWAGINSVGSSDTSDGDSVFGDDECSITQPGEADPSPTTCSNAQVLLQGAATSFQSDDACEIDMIMIEAPGERWCLSASAAPEAVEDGELDEGDPASAVDEADEQPLNDQPADEPADG